MHSDGVENGCGGLIEGLGSVAVLIPQQIG